MATEPEKTDEKKDFDNKLDVVQFCAEVHTNALKKNIREDIILASLTDKQTEYCKEMIRNAYYTKKLLEQIAEKTKNKTTTKYRKKQWKDYPKKIKEIAKQTFQTLILPVDATSILHRNKPNNHLLRLLLGLEETQVITGQGEEQNETINWIKQKLKPEPEK